MGSKWSQHRRQSSGSLSAKLWSKKKKRSVESGKPASSATETGHHHHHHHRHDVRSDGTVITSSGFNAQKRSCKPQHEFLTEDEQNALLKSWDAIKSSDLQLVGIKVLTRIFDLEPETKQTFSSFRNLSTLELLENPKFKSHAIRFMRAVEVTMENLDALDVIIIPNLKHLGQLHTDISGFKLSYLETVEQAMDEAWSDLLNGRPITVQGYISNNNNNNNSQNSNIYQDGKDNKKVHGYDQLTRSAWTKVFKLITSKIMEGYHEGNDAKLEKLKVKPPEASSSCSCSASIKESCPMEDWQKFEETNISKSKLMENTGRPEEQEEQEEQHDHHHHHDHHDHHHQQKHFRETTTTTSTVAPSVLEEMTFHGSAGASKETSCSHGGVGAACKVGNGDLQKMNVVVTSAVGGNSKSGTTSA